MIAAPALSSRAVPAKRCGHALPVSATPMSIAPVSQSQLRLFAVQFCNLLQWCRWFQRGAALSLASCFNSQLWSDRFSSATPLCYELANCRPKLQAGAWAPVLVDRGCSLSKRVRLRRLSPGERARDTPGVASASPNHLRGTFTVRRWSRAGRVVAYARNNGLIIYVGADYWKTGGRVDQGTSRYV
jgi:hypothetical protein